MARAVAILLVLTAAAPLRAQEAEPLGKSINIGPLGDSFNLLSADAVFDPMVGYRITLKLKAIRDVDTGELVCLAGFFNKGKHLLGASPLQFEASFPMLKGETVNAYCIFRSPAAEEGFPWYMIQVRLGKKANN